jgi:hypothetical protein
MLMAASSGAEICGPRPSYSVLLFSSPLLPIALGAVIDARWRRHLLTIGPRSGSSTATRAAAWS